MNISTADSNTRSGKSTSGSDTNDRIMLTPEICKTLPPVDPRYFVRSRYCVTDVARGRHPQISQ